MNKINMSIVIILAVMFISVASVFAIFNLTSFTNTIELNVSAKSEVYKLDDLNNTSEDSLKQHLEGEYKSGYEYLVVDKVTKNDKTDNVLYLFKPEDYEKLKEYNKDQNNESSILTGKVEVESDGYTTLNDNNQSVNQAIYNVQEVFDVNGNSL
ncbi:hypothetical protein [Methanobrevibacter filiformis]|uniref:Uncharacterized protein n=1 Tax=Methanobrevibacter filiformis TaxID=55758 RepID=A0A166D279_9EURY|nr:hypothetical protein [Methanobrevibacter filiformis]KZX15126.1 hypothetical protein MBFIL_07270 [Methanobrevibacter filiformis]